MEVINILVIFELLAILGSNIVAGNVISPSPLKMMLRPSTGLEGSSKNGPLNVILLLVDELNNRTDVISKLENNDAFPVHGSLKTCTVDNHYASGVGCDCDEKMRSSIASLLSWAEQDKSMSILLNGIKNPRTRVMNDQRGNPPWPLEIDWSPNEFGHLMIVRTKVDELDSVLKQSDRYIVSSNTLTIVTSSCPRNPPYTAPYFVGGFGSERFSGANQIEKIQDLISAIRTVVDENDQAVDVGAKNLQRTYSAFDDLVALKDTSGSVDSGIKKILQRHKRQTTTAAPSGQEAMGQSTMMILTAITVTIIYGSNL